MIIVNTSRVYEGFLVHPHTSLAGAINHYRVQHTVYQEHFGTRM